MWDKIEDGEERGDLRFALYLAFGGIGFLVFVHCFIAFIYLR